MKGKLNILVAAWMLVLLCSCQQQITFTEPQPTQTENLERIPKRLQGEYLSKENGSILTISNNLIVQVFDYDIKIHKNDLDSASQLSGDTLINLFTKTKTVIKREGDSISNHIHQIDTLFSLNNNNVIRKLKGYYFLNKRFNFQGWEVKKVSLLHGKLTISKISVIDEIDKLELITETPQDTIPHYEFKSSKKQFVKFIHENGFKDKEEFLRQ